MEVKQIYQLMNEVTKEVLGMDDVVQEDLSNIVEVGTQIFDANKVDHYVRSLVDHIGRVIFVDRKYTGNAPSVLMDGWTYGSVLEKIKTTKLPDAEVNEDWELQDGHSYDPHVFHKPSVAAKFFNKKVTFEITMSYTEMQVRESFSSVTQLNGFISMIRTSVENSMTVKLDALIGRTIVNFMGETIANEYTTLTDFDKTSGIRAVNLLYLYNQKYSKTLTPAAAVTDPEFIRFAAYTMGLYQDRLSRYSTLFNTEGNDRFTPQESLHTILLSEFRRAADVYLQSGVYHEEYTKLVNSEVVPFWQGTGDDYDFAHTSFINIKLASDNTKELELGGIIGVMFDRNALGVACMDRRIRSEYNPKGEFMNEFYKMDAEYFNDMGENGVVFFVA